MLKTLLVLGLMFGYSRATASFTETSLELLPPDCRLLEQKFELRIPKQGGGSKVVPISVTLNSEYARSGAAVPEAFRWHINGSVYSMSRQVHRPRGGRPIEYLRMQRQSGPRLDSSLRVEQDLSVNSKYPQGCRPLQDCGRIIRLCPNHPSENRCDSRDGLVVLNLENVNDRISLTALSQFEKRRSESVYNGVTSTRNWEDRRRLGGMDLSPAGLQSLMNRLRGRATPEMQRACARRAAGTQKQQSTNR